MPKTERQRATYTADFVPQDVGELTLLESPTMDNLVTAMIAMGAEVWSVRQRMKVMERLLEAKGVTSAMIEAYVPSDDEVADWRSERDAFIDRIYSILGQSGGLTLTAEWKK